MQGGKGITDLAALARGGDKQAITALEALAMQDDTNALTALAALAKHGNEDAVQAIRNVMAEDHPGARNMLKRLELQAPNQPGGGSRKRVTALAALARGGDKQAITALEAL